MMVNVRKVIVVSFGGGLDGLRVVDEDKRI